MRDLRPPIIVEEPGLAHREVAGEIAALVRAAGTGERPFVLGLPTGNSSVGLYRELVRMHQEEGLDLSGLRTFNLDEFEGIPASHPGSFRSWMQRTFFEHVNVQAENVRFPGNGVDYESAIRDAGGLDLAVLGIGVNGHIAFNEPGSAPDSRTRMVTLEASSRAASADLFPGEPVPERAFSMGIATILAARRIRLFAFGSGKAAIVRRLLEQPESLDLPASHLGGHPDLRLFLDRAAASEISAASR